MKISYSILTTPRKEPYLRRTLAALDKGGFFSKNGPLHLVAGSPDPEHLNPYRNDNRFVVHDMPKDEADGLLFQHAGVALRATWGHHRALHPWRVNDGSEAHLVMEDDISFTANWTEKLQEIADGILKAFGKRWVLCLYTPQSKEPLDAFNSGKKWIMRKYEGFYGAQAILYTNRARDEYLAYLVDHTIHMPHDLAMPEAMKKIGIPILATAPCLVQHMGSVTQGVSASFHSSESFLP